MDTRFWGPSGWRLLHLIASSNKATASRTFWCTLPYVLPCKFCRASLTTYYEQHPIPRQNKDFPEWLYKIHNLVNQKLRDQGQTLDPNPPFSSVKEFYDSLLQQGCTRTEFPGWDFLFSIADNHPDSSPSKPMPDAPEQVPKCLKDKNRYNMMTPKERKCMLRAFWKSVPLVLPFEEWRTAWERYSCGVQTASQSRRSALKWLYKIRCGMESELQQMSNTSFHGLCKQIATHRSGCSKSSRAKTCRRLRTNANGKTRRYR